MRERKGARRAERVPSKADRKQIVKAPVCTHLRTLAKQRGAWREERRAKRTREERRRLVEATLKFQAEFESFCVQFSLRIAFNCCITIMHTHIQEGQPHIHTWIHTKCAFWAFSSQSNAACQCVCVCTMCVYRGLYRVASLYAIIASFGAVLGLIATFVCHLHTHTLRTTQASTSRPAHYPPAHSLSLRDAAHLSRRPWPAAIH